ncbi:MAG: AAA family ATPase [Chloroflexia bacterium]|nr:AAA family ATPase [Chloroflexia bacterium]
MAYQKFTPVEIGAMDFPRPEWLVENLLVAGSAVLFPAREKAGKGLLAIDLACSIALGEPWLGHAVTEGSVVYLALEESMGTIWERLSARLAGRLDVPIYVVPCDGSFEQQFQLENVANISDIIEVVEEVEPALLIVDPLREAHTGREDSSDDMAPRLRAIRQLAGIHGHQEFVRRRARLHPQRRSERNRDSGHAPRRRPQSPQVLDGHCVQRRERSVDRHQRTRTHR